MNQEKFSKQSKQQYKVFWLFTEPLMPKKLKFNSLSLTSQVLIHIGLNPKKGFQTYVEHSFEKLVNNLVTYLCKTLSKLSSNEKGGGVLIPSHPS